MSALIIGGFTVIAVCLLEAVCLIPGLSRLLDRIPTGLFAGHNHETNGED